MLQGDELLPPDLHLGDPDNFVILCTNCHGGFDSSMPVFVILPTNMEFFIDYEERDYKSRTEGKELRPRSFPTSQEYKDAGGMYKAYSLQRGFTTSAEKGWGGSPAAMIYKASLGVNLPTDSIPPGIRGQVAKLMDLWGRRPPTPAKNEGKGKGRATKRRASDSPESQKYPRTRQGTTRKPITGKGGKPAKVVEKPEIMFPNLKPRNTPNLGLDGAWDYWLLGPNMSANDVIAKYTGYRKA